MRSRPRRRGRLVAGHGIISACAEQTRRWRSDVTCRRDHLRVCGADRRVDEERKPVRGSSPRVRSRPRIPLSPKRLMGIISACAEQTSLMAICRRSSGDHLRVCGADFDGSDGSSNNAGSSPRVRSRLRLWRVRCEFGGIISACAEQTGRLPCRKDPPRDHLRVCGADTGSFFGGRFEKGSSPRVRSRRHGRRA